LYLPPLTFNLSPFLFYTNRQNSETAKRFFSAADRYKLSKGPPHVVSGPA
jgi:hypothetical protein